MEKLIQRNYRIGKHHDMIVKRCAKKLKISEGAVMRLRIKPFAEMLKELQEDMAHAEFISLKNM